MRKYDSGSDSFPKRIEQLTHPEKGQSSKGAHGGSSEQLWFVQAEENHPQKKTLGATLKLIEKGTPKKRPLSHESQSPEIFMSDDNIINPQESSKNVADMKGHQDVVMEGDAIVEAMGEGLNQEMVKTVVIEDRRRSERLKKDAGLTIQEKIEKAGAAKNLEGTIKNSNLFAILEIVELNDIASKMGVCIDSEDFDTFNLITNLENARNDLYLKQIENKKQSQTETVEVEEPVETFLDNGYKDESSGTEGFILAHSRKKKKRND
jgi:hypothetical protein